MAYVKNTWVDQDVERPKTYQVTTNQDGSITLTDDFGLVTELGTPVNSTNMNHIEDGIDNHETRITVLEGASNANTNLSNVTDTGTSTGASWAMPSSTYDNLTLGASGTTYTAPANGYYYLKKRATAVGQYVSIRPNTTDGQYIGSDSYSVSSNGLPAVWFPVKKGDIVYVTYTASGSDTYLKFYYAVGSESEA